MKRKVYLFPLIAILIGLLFVPTSTYANLIVGAILKQIDTARVFVAVRKPDLAFAGLYSEELVVRPQKSPIGVTFQDVRIRPLFSDIFRGRATLRITGNWLQGKFLLHWSPFRDELSLKLAGIQLHQFPPLQGLGLQKGVVSGELLNLKFRKDGSMGSLQAVSLNLAGVEKPQETDLRRYLSKLPFSVTIPKLSDTSLKVKGSGDETQFTIQDLQFVSNLGKISGGAQFKTKNPPEVTVAMDGILSKQGFSSFGDAVKLFSNGKIKNAQQPFKVVVS